MFFKLAGMILMALFVVMGAKWGIENIYIKKSNKRKTRK